MGPPQAVLPDTLEESVPLFDCVEFIDCRALPPPALTAPTLEFASEPLTPEPCTPLFDWLLFSAPPPSPTAVAPVFKAFEALLPVLVAVLLPELVVIGDDGFAAIELLPVFAVVKADKLQLTCRPMLVVLLLMMVVLNES